MARTAAVISAALVVSKEGITDYLTVDKKVNEFQPANKWKMTGRHNQLARRLK